MKEKLQTTNNDSIELHSKTNQEEQQFIHIKQKKKKSRHIRTSSLLSAKGNSSCFEASTTDDDTIIEPNKSSIDQGDTTLCTFTTEGAITPNFTRLLQMNTDGALRNSEPQDQTRNQVKERNARSITTKAVQRRKLCIVSTNKRNKILNIAKNTFQNYEICHYVSPNCNTEQLISNLDKKLIDYTMDDFCVILIGENDLYKTDNYVNIIIKLRETLQKVQNTNIIICVPTFKLSNYSILFNWRIETFNNLLYLDLQTTMQRCLILT